MKLYILPGACSLAADISLREAGIQFDLVKVDRKTRKTTDDLDFDAVNSKGYVPALRLDSGELLTENVAVLQYIADRNPAAKLAPPAGTMERYRLEEWLSFINSEVHKGGFNPLFSRNASEDMKQYARGNLTKRLDWVATSLGTKPFLTGDQFTVADAYLFVILSWSAHVAVDLSAWPVLKSFLERVGARPHVNEALVAEGLKK